MAGIYFVCVYLFVRYRLQILFELALYKVTLYLLSYVRMVTKIL